MEADPQAASNFLTEVGHSKRTHTFRSGSETDDFEAVQTRSKAGETALRAASFSIAGKLPEFWRAVPKRVCCRRSFPGSGHAGSPRVLCEGGL